MAAGDHIAVNRGGYEHHGVDLGDGTVVHFNRESRFGPGSRIRRTSRWMFARGNAVHVETKPAAAETAAEAVRLAKRLIGQPVARSGG
ncbi:lecithin retinol acyltransferase family protein [Saccharothrix deserti]|uniref:lecithin retinol acyltransferase family protein n=1 Tax=Saccharothrix deserti TaxID=2593674 RepID=UPI00131E1B60